MHINSVLNTYSYIAKVRTFAVYQTGLLEMLKITITKSVQSYRVKVYILIIVGHIGPKSIR